MTNKRISGYTKLLLSHFSVSVALIIWSLGWRDVIIIIILSFILHGFFSNLHQRFSYILALNLHDEQCKAEKNVSRGWCGVLCDVTQRNSTRNILAF